MAYRRSITARAKFFYQHQQRISPSISNIHRDDNNDPHELQSKPISRDPEIGYYIQHRFFESRNNFSNFRRPTSFLHDRRFAVPAGYGMSYGRNYSSASVGEGAADKFEVLNDAAAVLGNNAVEAAPALNEVAVAATDSYAPVAAIQYFIDYVHQFTGFNWWASIVVATLILRSLQVPIQIHQLKSSAKLALLKPELEAIKEEMQNKGMDPSGVESQMKMGALFKKYNVRPYAPFIGLLITGPMFCCFFFGVSNMAGKVSSFSNGGISWFTDLSTPDSLFLFPVLSGLLFWITVECNAQEGMENNPNAVFMKNLCRVFAVISVPLTASFPTAVFCYWITSNVFSLVYGLVIKRAAVKEFLGVPIVPVDTKPGVSFIESIKKYVEAKAEAETERNKQYSLPSFPKLSKKSEIKRIASATALDERVKGLEKKVKGRKRGKKR